MPTQPWYKSELTIAGTIITLLLAVSIWFIKAEIMDSRDQNKLQWATFSRDISCLKERVAHLEGYHQAEKDYGCKAKGEGK